jgi:hypothetical protein
MTKHLHRSNTHLHATASLHPAMALNIREPEANSLPGEGAALTGGQGTEAVILDPHQTTKIGASKAGSNCGVLHSPVCISTQPRRLMVRTAPDYPVGGDRYAASLVILQNEPEQSCFNQASSLAEHRWIACRRRRERRSGSGPDHRSHRGVSADRQQAEIAPGDLCRLNKCWHTAGFDPGHCISYALTKWIEATPLFKGDVFIFTKLQPDCTTDPGTGVSMRRPDRGEICRISQKRGEARRKQGDLARNNQPWEATPS